MARTLDVYLFRELAGHLIQDDGGQMVFNYAENWLQQPDATPLSHSLPLRRERFTRKECRGYFAGVLPEESNREIIARNLGISERTDYAMLERIGGECAGAVTFLPATVRPCGFLNNVHRGCYVNRAGLLCCAFFERWGTWFNLAMVSNTDYRTLCLQK